MFTKLIKRLGVVLLILAMMYASNWDLPKETKEGWNLKHAEELENYYNRELNVYVINGEVYEGMYLDGMWYEPLEIYGGAIPDEFMENDDANL